MQKVTTEVVPYELFVDEQNHRQGVDIHIPLPNVHTNDEATTAIEVHRERVLCGRWNRDQFTLYTGWSSFFFEKDNIGGRENLHSDDLK